MVEALSLIKLQNRVRERYDYDEQRVVGIILARYDIRITKEIVDQCYQYWNLNSRKYFDVFWAGYGAYLSPSEESATKTILKYRGNEKRATSTHLAVENVFGIRLGKSRKPKELSDFI